ncbi:hypothetical protein ABZ281_02800 [Streptomyces sp. NPDC006265]|uniref:hypothetical protein n=1 Tax=Streptomyces sp. NPDC006265 TaxID=3156740 RepID=UPI0033B7AF0F
MALLAHTGTLRTQYLNEIRNMHVFHVERPVTLIVQGIYTAPQERLAWMECQQGTWRLPAAMRDWAEEIEERAQVLVGHAEIFPCPIVFAPKADGQHFEVELRPRGYKPFLLA